MSNGNWIIGNAASDAKVERGFVEITIADNPAGKAKERFVTRFVRCSFKEDSVLGTAAALVKKGERLFVTGQEQVREYEKKDGGKGYSIEIPYVEKFYTLSEKESEKDPFGL